MVQLLTICLRWVTGKVLIWISISIVCFVTLLVSFLAGELIRKSEDKHAHWNGIVNQEKIELYDLRKSLEDTNQELEKLRSSLDKIEAEVERLKELKEKFDKYNWFHRWWKKTFYNKDYEKDQKRIEKIDDMQDRLKGLISRKKELNKEKEEREKSKGEKEDKLRKHESERDRAQLMLETRKKTLSDLKAIVLPWFHSSIKVGVWITVITIVLPFLYGCLFYFGLSPILDRSKPVIFQSVNSGGEVVCEGSKPSVKVKLDVNHEMVAKEEFLQASEEELTKSTCWLWKWKYPFSCIACGLVFLTRIQLDSINVTIQVPTLALVNEPPEDGQPLLVRGWLF